QLPKIVERHEQTAGAIHRCVEVSGVINKIVFHLQRVSKVVEVEKEEPVEEQPEPSKPIDPIEEKKKELLRELSTLGMGQVAKIKRLLKRIEELNEEYFRANLATPLARHELMTLLAEQALRLPLYVTPVGEFPPPRVGAITASDAYKLSVGDYCAAFCEDMWILGEVKSIADNGRYEIRDVDDSEKPLTILARRRVIPLPQYRADPVRDAHAIFPVNAWILALYPQTTVFYKGIVEEPPKSATDPYKVSFDDATYPSGFSPPLEVPQRYVLAFRETAYKPREKGGDKSEREAAVPEMSKEEMREQKAAEREKKRLEKAEETKQQKIMEKERKKAEKAEMKEQKREEKMREKERKKKEKAKEKKRLAKERRMLRKKEAAEKKEQKKTEEEEKEEGGSKDEAAEREVEEEPREEEEEDEDKEEEDEKEEDEEEEEEERDDGEEEEKDSTEDEM
ncbi:hypothetical protein PFISCL1PPCAC_26666, partial [Pristionchus fissidentatus]